MPRPLTLLGAAIILLALTTTLAAQNPPTYPEGAPTPRSLTETEAHWLATHPLALPEAPTAPPTGPIHCVAEYEPMAAILIAWEGPSSWLQILATMAGQITTTGNADVWVVVDTTIEREQAAAMLAAAGVSAARLRFFVVTTNTIWIRDYGPRYVYQGDCRAIVDHTYNRPRPDDNAFNTFLAGALNQARYEIPLIHGGGNYHLDALARGRATRLVVNENPTLTEPQIHDLWQSYQNVDTTFYQPFPTSVDSTQHIDMWMQVIADHAVVISDWPNNAGSIQDQICDGAAVSMAAEGYTVFRVPAFSVGGVHYTYTNVVMCNGLVLIPSYTNATVAPYNSQALAAWQAAVPGKTVVPVDCQAIVSAAGVMHCIVMHVPVPKGGVNPTAYLVAPNGGEVLQPGASEVVQWVSDDDQGTTSADVHWSQDGGQSWLPLAQSVPDSGSFTWTVPNVCSGAVRLQVVVHDAQGHTGSDQSDGDLVVNGTGCSASVMVYGTGTAGAAGVPALAATPPVLGSRLSLTVGQAAPHASTLLLVGTTATQTPLLGGTLLVPPATFVALVTDGSGGAALALPVPAATVLAGQSLFWQAWVQDAGGPAGWAATVGVETRLGL